MVLEDLEKHRLAHCYQLKARQLGKDLAFLHQEMARKVAREMVITQEMCQAEGIAWHEALLLQYIGDGKTFAELMASQDLHLFAKNWLAFTFGPCELVIETLKHYHVPAYCWGNPWEALFNRRQGIVTGARAHLDYFLSLWGQYE